MRVLIVSPHAPPSNAADMQRVRMLLPYLGDIGIDAEVLAVRSEDVVSPLDPWLAEGLPPEVPIHRVQALSLKWARLPGLGTLEYRALLALRRVGDALLAEGAFDLVYFSTTVFPVHILGPRWKRKFGVPFVMDYQDPWVSDYYREHPEVVPPGGRLKYAVVDWLNRRMEPQVLRQCSGITSVSVAYPEQLEKRYPWLQIEDRTGGWRPADGEREEDKGRQGSAFRPPSSALHRLPSTVLPFPGDVRDFERVREDGIQQTVFDPDDGFMHWVYVGRGGEDMQQAAAAIFKALRLHAETNPGFLGNLRLHFVGTSYAAAGVGRKTLEGLADALGLRGVVTEHTDRIPYSQALRCLLDADAMIVPGSDDPGYTASKIYPYLLARKPLLAVFHEMSSVVKLINSCGGAICVSFKPSENSAAVADRIVSNWLGNGAFKNPVQLNANLFAPYTAPSAAAALVGFFKGALNELNDFAS